MITVQIAEKNQALAFNVVVKERRFGGSRRTSQQNHGKWQKYFQTGHASLRAIFPE
jgi:hypothetical protein